MSVEVWTLFVRPGNCPDYKAEGRVPYVPGSACILARSLRPYGIRLNVLTDQPEAVEAAAEKGKVDNLAVHPITPEMTEGLAFEPGAWWWKMLFYNPRFFGDREILFIDLDTIALQDPSPILEFIRETKKPIIYRRETTCEDEFFFFSSTQYYLNHRVRQPGYVWLRFLDEPKMPGKTDDGWLHNSLPELYSPSELAKYIGWWPREFSQCYQSRFAADLGLVPGGAGRPGCLFLNFFGHFSLECVLANRLSGWRQFSQYIGGPAELGTPPPTVIRQWQEWFAAGGLPALRVVGGRRPREDLRQPPPPRPSKTTAAAS